MAIKTILMEIENGCKNLGSVECGEVQTGIKRAKLCVLYLEGDEMAAKGMKPLNQDKKEILTPQGIEGNIKGAIKLEENILHKNEGLDSDIEKPQTFSKAKVQQSVAHSDKDNIFSGPILKGISAFHLLRPCSGDGDALRSRILSHDTASSPLSYFLHKCISDSIPEQTETKQDEDSRKRTFGYRKKAITHRSQKGLSKRSRPEEDNSNGSFLCSYCSMMFNTAQALGGHMSRTHSGRSPNYNHKQEVRKRREFDRIKLLLAKRRFYSSIGIDFERERQSNVGKQKLKKNMNRSKIKKIKTSIKDDEVNIYILAKEDF